MAGAALYLFHPASIWMHLCLTEVIDFIFCLEEGWPMTVTDVVRGKCAWRQRTETWFAKAREAHLPSR
jgi:hypothetical protein